MNNRDRYFHNVKKSITNGQIAHFIAATAIICSSSAAFGRLCGYKEHGCGDCIFQLGREKEIKKWLKSEFIDDYKGSPFDERIFPTKKSSKKNK